MLPPLWPIEAKGLIGLSGNYRPDVDQTGDQVADPPSGSARERADARSAARQRAQHRRGTRWLPAFASLAAVAALSVSGTAAAFAGSGPAAAARTGQLMLSAGQVGARSAVPWRSVGSGWALANYTQGTQKAAKPTTLYLIDPAGGKYRLYQWPASTTPWYLVGWSGDKTRALFEQPTNAVPTMQQLVLATGRVTTFRLPAAVQAVIGYTDPDGKNILAVDDGIVRFSLTGAFQARLIKGTRYGTALSVPTGTSYVVNGRNGVELVSNRGGIIRTLPVPGIHGSTAGCSPVRWWTASTALVSCSTSKGSQLWLVPVSGAAPKALTALRNGSTPPDLMDFDAWRFGNGLYTQSAYACGALFIGKQAANGKVTMINVPGSPDNNVVAATSGSRMLVKEINGCTPSVRLAWFNPATRAAQTVLRATTSEFGVLSVIAYNRDGNQPGYPLP
jgi:hypothetical protein